MRPCETVTLILTHQSPSSSILCLMRGLYRTGVGSGACAGPCETLRAVTLGQYACRLGLHTSAVVRIAWPSSLTMMVPKTPCTPSCLRVS